MRRRSTDSLQRCRILSFQRHVQGWLPWLGDFGLKLNTRYYVEVENHGPAAKWRGVTYQQAQKYTVERFIQGQQWLPKLGVPFIPVLLPKQRSGRIH